MKVIPKTNKQFKKAISEYNSVLEQAVNKSDPDLAEFVKGQIEYLTKWMSDPERDLFVFKNTQALIMAEEIFKRDKAIASVTLEFTKPTKSYYNINTNFNIKKVCSPIYDPCYPDD